LILKLFIMSHIDHTELVKQFLSALNDDDFTLAKNFAADDMQFIGVLGSRDGANAYFADMEHIRLKYDIIKTFTGDDDVCVWYNIAMPGGTNVLSSGWYAIQNGKIQTIKVLFDPRPVLDAGKKSL